MYFVLLPRNVLLYRHGIRYFVFCDLVSAQAFVESRKYSEAEILSADEFFSKVSIKRW